MSKKTTYQLKRDLQVFNEQSIKLNEEMIDQATKGNSQEVVRIKDELANIEISRKAIKEELDKREKEDIENLELVDKYNPIENRGTIYRSILKGESIPDNIKRGLFGTNSTPNTGGDNLVPTNLGDVLISECANTNPIRDIATVTNIVGLELPRVSYKIDDMEFVSDGEIAKELELKGEKVKFNNFGFRISTEISDSLLEGTNTNLVNYIERALKEGLVKKEKYSIFKTNKTEEKHMNIYSDTNAVKKVQGDTLFKAIKNALSDLCDEFYNNATIVMHRNDYYSMIDELSNNNTNFYDKQNHQILGVKVVFCEDAHKPVIGDFRYLHLNYYTDTKLESERIAREGRNFFILSGSFDIRLILTSAFRIAETTPTMLSTRSKKEN